MSPSKNKKQKTENKPVVPAETIQKPSTKRTRVFSIITYVSEADIQDAIRTHTKSLRAFAYILHDRDEAEPHYHLLLRTYDAWSSTQITKWFDKYKLRDNNNTFVEPATDLHALQEYITHSDYQSIKEGKHQYSVEEVVDGGLFDMIEQKDSYDGTFEIVNAMLQGVPTRTLVRRYGKQLIYHYSQFCAIVEAINSEDRMQAAYIHDQQNHGCLVPVDNDANIDDIFPTK